LRLEKERKKKKNEIFYFFFPSIFYTSHLLLLLFFFMGVCLCVTCVAYIIFYIRWRLLRQRNRDSCQPPLPDDLPPYEIISIHSFVEYFYLFICIYIYLFIVDIDCNLPLFALASLSVCPFMLGFIDSNFSPLYLVLLLLSFGYSASVYPLSLVW
jgi:hypothetical protein